MRSTIHKSNAGDAAGGSGAPGIRDAHVTPGVPSAPGHVCDVTCIHPEAVEKARESAIDRSTAMELSQIFQVMADPTRLRIISLLAGRELCVCDIAAALDMTQSAVSHQLRVMRMADLVKFRKDGRIAWYSLDDDHVEKLFIQGVNHIRHFDSPE